MKMSIVTVCLNAEKNIEKTLQSVCRQSYCDIQYIIIDGKSCDQTCAVIKKYAETYPRMTLISEPDRGIYDAMNKAIPLLQGEYVFFLNCGDRFAGRTTVEDIVKELEAKGRPDLLYGNVDYVYRDHIEHHNYTQRRKLSQFWMAAGITVCHQAVWVKSSLMREKRFDISYRIWADQEFLAYCLKKKVTIETSELTLCLFDAYGFSSDKKDISRKECDRISAKYTPLFYMLFYCPKKLVRWREAVFGKGKDENSV